MKSIAAILALASSAAAFAPQTTSIVSEGLEGSYITHEQAQKIEEGVTNNI